MSTFQTLPPNIQTVIPILMSTYTDPTTNRLLHGMEQKEALRNVAVPSFISQVLLY